MSIPRILHIEDHGTFFRVVDQFGGFTKCSTREQAEELLEQRQAVS